MDWLDVKVSKPELQNLEDNKFRSELLASLKPIRESLLKKSKYFYWYFDSTDVFLKYKQSVCMVIKVGTDKKQEVEKELLEFFTKKGYSKDEIQITKDDPSLLTEKYGREGLVAFHDFMNASCAYVIIKEEKFVNTNEGNFLHFFVSALGYYFPQEAVLHLDIFARRMALMFPYTNYADFKKQVLKVTEEHLDRYFQPDKK